ncbi:MAG: two-component regulator propeller domain-containing protein, partial [Saprospiraceae bacterium]
WIATEYGGVEKYDPNASKFRRGLLPIERGFSQFSFVSCVLRDRLDPTGQRYWMAVWGTGLFEWNRHTNVFRFIPARPNNALNGEIFDLAQDSDGTLYVANAGGLTVYNPRTNEAHFFNDFMQYPFVSNKALAILIDHAGQVWIGANYDGLFRYNPQTKTIQKIPFYKPSEIKKTTGYITAIREDANQQLWIATHSGVFRLNPKTGESRFIHGGELPDIYRSDGLWIGQRGSIWVATVEGLVQLDTNGKFIRRYGSEDGLQSEHIFDVLEDRNGLVWLATTNKLHRLNPQTNEILPFDKSDGLFNNALTDAFNLSDRGEIFIGFQNAFNFFDPLKVPFNAKPPKITLTDLQVLNQEKQFDPTQPVVLHPKENVVSFEFAALNFSQSAKNRYAYRLEGFDPDWIYTDQPIATYTNLDGGDYTLWVKAANNDGVWSAPVTLATLHVIPPFRRTWLFWGLLVLLGFSIVAGILWYRWQQRLQLEAVRDRIARDLHDDVGSTLSSIRFFSEFARSKVVNPEVTPILQRINESAATLSESMQDIIWTINSKHDQLDDLVTRMRQFALRLLEARNIRFHTNVSEHFLPTRLTINQRRNIYLIFKEAVTNAAKYADCSEVELRLHQVKRYLKMVITDNGKGFDLESVQRGNGLLNMQKRASEIGGSLSIHTQPGTGTCIELMIKI